MKYECKKARVVAKTKWSALERLQSQIRLKVRSGETSERDWDIQ